MTIEPHQANTMHQQLSPQQRGRKRHEKNPKFSSYFAVQNQLLATLCSGPQLLVEECRLGGIPPVFGSGAECLGNFSDSGNLNAVIA